jgi:hypothetical protein
MSEMVLRLRGNFTFADKQNRKNFIELMSSLLNNKGSRFEPYQLNESTTDLEWVVDAGNDWWVFFDREDKKQVRIRHRYDSREALIPLGGWLAYRHYCEVVTPEYKIDVAEQA